ncbi:MAG: hypothetical protein ACK4VI_05135 [Alphaproteobacteria bacterium]
MVTIEFNHSAEIIDFQKYYKARHKGSATLTLESKSSVGEAVTKMMQSSMALQMQAMRTASTMQMAFMHGLFAMAHNSFNRAAAHATAHTPENKPIPHLRLVSDVGLD